MGEEEYNMILDLQPDIVFTDNQMPKKNGMRNILIKVLSI